MNIIPFSIYIPRMSATHNEESVRRFMELLSVGVVSRVDFTPIDKKPGFEENVDSVVKSAFIHFAYTDSQLMHGYPYNEEIWGRVARGKQCNIQVSEKEYWIFLKNNTPIKETLMNIHQVVENGRHLEKLIEEQANTIKQQERMINELSESLDRVKSVVYQLVGGVYCQYTQGNVINAHLKDLYPSDEVFQNPTEEEEEEEEEPNKWTIWPTTRQGDACERRIEALERMLNNQNEELDNQLMARKHRSVHSDDSSIDSALVEEAERLQNEEIEAWREERYREMQEEADVDRAADADSWDDMRW